MKIFTKLCAVCVMLFFSLSAAYAQKDTSDAPAPKKQFLKLGLNFLSNNVYLGRTDSVAAPTLSPTIKYSFASGIYLSGAMDIITNRKKNKLDGGNLEFGYDHIGDGDVDWGASFTKLFFNSTSTQVDATVSGELNAYVDYDVAEIVTASLGLNYQVAKSGYTGDLLLSPVLSHDFLVDGVFGDDDELLISPSVALNAGSQNFYSGYLVRKGKIAAKRVNAAYDAYNTALGNFTLLDYELSAPIAYIAGKFTFSFTPTIAFAQNSLPTSTPAEKAITATIERSQPVRSSEFYVETGISFKF